MGARKRLPAILSVYLPSIFPEASESSIWISELLPMYRVNTSSSTSPPTTASFFDHITCSIEEGSVIFLACPV